MSSVAISLVVLVCVFGGGLLGTYLRSVLPESHLSAESKDTVVRGMGLVATMAALVLGLLVASAKGSYDAQSNSLIQMSANIVLLDRMLARYGPEARGTRQALRDAVLNVRDRMQAKGPSESSKIEPASLGSELFYQQIQQLSPKGDTQRSLQQQALNMAVTVGQTRWLMYEQSAAPVPVILVAVLVLWLTIIFVSFGLFAPRNPTVIFTFFIAALSVAGAVFVIIEMYRPFEGLIQISTAPLQAAIAHLCQ